MTDTAQSRGETVLVINLIGMPPASCRGVKQTLRLIEAAANFRRTVNFNLKNTAPAASKKYATEISCTDLNVPCLAGIFPGAEIVIECVSELSWLTVGGSPGRTIVDGSSYEIGDMTIGRPVLNCTVTDFQWDTDETEATVGWRLTAEET